MAEIRIAEVRGLDELRRKMTTALFARPMHAFFERLMDITARGARTEIDSDTGALAGSLETHVASGRLPSFGEVRALASHAGPVFAGARPHFPPVDALAGWAARHGLSAWAVARTIARRGTKARPFMRAAMQRARSEVEPLLRRAGDDLAREWAR